MLKKSLAAALAAALLTSGCVLVPTGSVGPRMASLDKVTVAVLLPEGTDLDKYSGGTPWHRARLTVSRLDGGAPDLVQPLEGTKGGLKAKAPLRNLAPGAPYRMDIELIQDQPGGLERVIARGARGVDEDTAVELKPGSNTLQIPVAPTVKGDRISLEPIVLKKPARRSSDDDDFDFRFDFDDEDEGGSPDTTVVDSDEKAIAQVIGIVGGALIAGLLGADDEKQDASAAAKKKAGRAR